MPSPAPVRVLVPGTVLFDVYAESDETHLGGAEFNLAYHLHHLIGGVDLVARVGADDPGRRLLAELERRGFPTRFIQTDPVHPSKLVTVTRDARGEPCFHIPDNVASEYLEMPPLSVADLSAYGLVCFGTTLQAGERSRATLRALLAGSRGLKFCDLNLRPPKYTRETVEYSLRTCDALKLNDGELGVLTGLLGLPEGREAAVRRLSEAFDIPTVCVTLGRDGALLFSRGVFHAAPASPVRVADTVGAGDAFSACLALGLLRGWPPERTLSFATDLASAVCAIRGAVPRDGSFYEPFRDRV